MAPVQKLWRVFASENPAAARQWVPVALISIAGMALTGPFAFLPPRSHTVVEAPHSQVDAWHALLADARVRALPERDRLTAVNAFVNRVRLVASDRRLDHWASPAELFANNSGDARAFVVAKYVALRKLGVSDNKLLVMHVKDVVRNRPHVVLAYVSSATAEPLILDAARDEVHPASSRDDLAPIYATQASTLLQARSRAGRAPKLTL